MARTGSDESGADPSPRFFEAPWHYGGPDAVESVDADARRQLVVDLIVLWRLRRLVADAWTDLSRPPES